MRFLFQVPIKPYTDLFQSLMLVENSKSDRAISPEYFHFSLTKDGKVTCFVHPAKNLKGLPMECLNSRQVHRSIDL